MKKKLFYLIIPLIFISFSQNVKAENIKHIEYIDPYYNQKFEFDLDIDLYPYYYLTINYHDSYKNKTRFILHYSTEEFYYNSDFKYSNNMGNSWSFLPKNNVPIYIYSNSYPDINNFNTITINDCYQGFCEWKNPNYFYMNLNSDNVLSFLEDITFPLTTNTPTNGIVALINYDVYDLNGNLKYNKDYFNNNNGYVSKPVLSYVVKPIYKDGYLSSYGIKVNSSIVDDTLYKYQYSIKDNIDNELNWIDLYNNNFINNEFSYITKKPIYFYFRIVDKSNNDVIDSFTVTLTFNLVSPQYDIIFNQNRYYLSGTNIIDRLGLSITYKTSLDGLKYQYQYVNDGSSLSEENWVDTESNIFRVYDVNGVMYARILDNDNNVLYSATFSNTLIGKQDILENPTNFPLYNKVQKVLNFNSGSISDLVLVPVKVLMFMSDSLNNKSCSEYFFGKLLGHELKLPCIDIKSYVGNTIYNFYDLVCSFFISLGIVKLLKNIYMRFMTLDIRDIDRNGGIF